MATTINSNTTDGVVITPDTSGEIELQANGVTKAKITANGLQDNNGNSLRGGMYRNLIINGDMNIAQRGTSFTSNGYTLDRFVLSNSAGSWTITQDTDVPAGQGFANSLKMQCTTANTSLGASEYIILEHKMEGQQLQHLKKGTSNAESLTLSFWVKSNKTGTHVAEIDDNDNTRNINKSYTIDTADTWEKKTITFEGDTTGTLDNDKNHSLRVIWWIASGSGFTSGTLQTSWASTVDANRAVGVDNYADSTSNYINITGVQLEVGEGASDFEHLPYDVQLQRCQRYYFQTDSARVDTSGYATGALLHSRAGSTAYWGQVPLTTVMRTQPSYTIYSYDGTAGSVSTGASGAPDISFSLTAVDEHGFLVGGTPTASTDTLYAKFKADAEL